MERLNMDAVEQKMLSRVEFDTNGGCWLWPGSTAGGGYGKIKISGIFCTLHRLAWIIFRGPIPEGHNVLHKCDVPACFNPNHLFTGTCQDNSDDMVSKGRTRDRVGEKNPKCRLTEADVIEIRRRLEAGEKGVDLAAVFSVHKETIYSIHHRRSWGHI